MEPQHIPGAMTREMRRLGQEAGRSRSMPSTLRVGDPDGEHVTIAVEDWYDAGARLDLVMRALDALGAGDWLVWLRRTGGLDAEDGDCAWLAAARAAFAAHDSALACFHVVTRHGWHELVGGHREEWLRPRSHQV